MRSATSALLLLVLASFGTRPSALQPSSDEIAHTVRLDVILTDARGRFVDNLKTGDFDLTEDSMSRPIESVRLVRLDQVRQGGGSPDGARMFAIYLDEYHISPGAGVARARGALARFIMQELRPNDLIVVMKPLESLFDIHMTHDRETAAHIVAGLDGRRGDYTPRSDYEKNYMAGDPERIETAREQVVLSALNALAVNLGPLGDGRKNLIVVTEAIGRPQQRRGQEYLATLENAIRSATRSNTAVYVVDPREAPSDDPGSSGRQAIQLLATQTSGLVIVDADLDAGLQRVAREANAYYVLTYRSTHKEDGRFHPVRVRVNRPRIKVRATAGYWAPSGEDALRTEILTRANEPKPPPPAPEPPRRISTLIQPWFGLARADRGRTRVTFVWEPTARVPGDRTQRDASRIELTALGSDDTVVFDGPVLPVGPTAAGEQAGRTARAVFDAPTGRLRLRMKIQDRASKQIDTDVRDLAIREWRPIAVGTPEILRTRNALEFRSIDADPNATPVASREFSRTERLIIRFPTYAPEGERQTVTAKLLGRADQLIRDLPVEMASTPDGRHRIDLLLAGFPPGEYTVELSTRCEAGEASERLGFRVTN
jgi:VWFA-related protein